MRELLVTNCRNFTGTFKPKEVPFHLIGRNVELMSRSHTQHPDP